VFNPRVSFFSLSLSLSPFVVLEMEPKAFLSKCSITKVYPQPNNLPYLMKSPTINVLKFWLPLFFPSAEHEQGISNKYLLS
jgi:hypothetical protein